MINNLRANNVQVQEGDHYWKDKVQMFDSSIPQLEKDIDTFTKLRLLLNNHFVEC